MRMPLISANRRVRPPSLPSAPPPSGADNLRGAALMVAAVSFYTFNDTAMKFVAESLPLYQSITIRGVMTSLILAVMVRAGMGGALPARISRRDGVLLAVRVAGEVGSTLLYLTALTHMALGDMGAIIQSTPLFVILAAVLFLGERIGWRRGLALGVGFAGVIIIIRPGTPRFDGWALMALGSVLLVVVRDISTRLFSAAMPASLVALTSGVSVTLAALAMSLAEGWQTPTPGQFGLLALAAVLLCVGYLASILTMRVGEVSFVTPFRYASLIVAVVLGYLVFDEFPDLWTWLGAALIVGAGIFVIWREAGQGRG